MVNIIIPIILVLSILASNVSAAIDPIYKECSQRGYKKCGTLDRLLLPACRVINWIIRGFKCFINSPIGTAAFICLLALLCGSWCTAAYQKDSRNKKYWQRQSCRFHLMTPNNIIIIPIPPYILSSAHIDLLKQKV